MKNRTLHIILVLLISSFISCKNKRAETNKIKFNKDIEFSSWLKKHELEKKMFTDSSNVYAFELWGWTDPLTKSDSLNFKEFSTDSSYMLISNFNTKTPSIENLDYYTFGFLPKNDQNFFIGIGVENEYPKNKIIDYHWVNDNTFVLLTSETESEPTIYNLMKLKIKVDSIWNYKTK